MEGRLCKLCTGVSNCMVGGGQIWYQPKPPPMHLDCLNVVHTRKSSWRWYLLLLRLTKSAKREAEDWARQTKRTLGEPSLIKYQSNNISRIISLGFKSPLMISVKQKFLWSAFSLKILIVKCSVMEMIKHRKHSWISRPRRQVSVMLIGESYWQMMVGNQIGCFWIFVLKLANLNKIDPKASDPLDSVVGLGYEEHSGIMEMELDSR